MIVTVWSLKISFNYLGTGLNMHEFQEIDLYIQVIRLYYSSAVVLPFVSTLTKDSFPLQ
ncbi:hypothetical protein CEAn_00643 [Coxiella endosymbiont of Amblyomma nuttalli]|nr:hypothetical protein CEAn_00643 [Coxiella endosymbiont of Amblyomma nuttalli]